MAAANRRLVLGVFLVVLALCAAGILGGIAAAEHGDEEEPGNETIHEHPDEVEGDGDIRATADWLGIRLGDMLGDSVIQIEESEYELASQFVDDAFEERLSDYVQIADRTGRESDSEATERLEETQERQQEYIEESREFEETYEEYQEAVRAGDDERARELARELIERGERIDTLGDGLTEDYEALSERLPVDLREDGERIDAHRDSLMEARREVEAAQFVETEITITNAETDASFRSPLAVDGNVRDANGEPVESGRIELRIDEHVESGELSAAGIFTAAHRPTTTALGTTNATVVFVPDSGSAYLGSETEIPVTIEQVTPTLEIVERPEETRYGNEVPIEGTIEVDGEPVPDVPVTIRLGDERLGETRAGPDGTFQLHPVLGAVPSTGSHELEAEIALTDRAIDGATAVEPITIEETQTDLSMWADENDDGELVLTGQLETREGEPVAQQPITVAVDRTDGGGERVTTDGAGEFSIALSPPDGADETAVTVTASFDGEGTNLASSDATDTAILSATGPGGDDGTDGGWPSLLDPATSLLGAVLVGGVLLVGAYLLRRWRRTDDATPGDRDGAVPTDSPGAAMAKASLEETDALEAAMTQQDDDADAAIRLAYGLARSHLADRVEEQRSATHWEFYRQAAAGGLSAIEDLRILTEHYELAAFAPAGGGPADARSAIDAARRLRNA